MKDSTRSPGIKNHESRTMKRRNFIATTSAIAGALVMDSNITQAFADKKNRIAIVGTGSRSLGMWSKDVAETYPERVEFVGLCDINPGRLEYFRKATGFTCPTFVDFEKMMKETRPDTLVVTTVDATHHDFIIRGMELGANIITEKPMTTDEEKCEAIIQPKRRQGRKSS